MFYVPDVSDDQELMLGGPTGVASAQGTSRQARGFGGGIPPYPQQRWVAVDSLTRSVVDANIEQPDPERLVLCACINKYGCICYGYHDEIPRWYRVIRILTVVFAILATPLSLFCFLPALDYMKKVMIRVLPCKVCVSLSLIHI